MKQETMKRRVERENLDEIPADEVTLKMMKKNENISVIE